MGSWTKAVRVFSIPAGAPFLEVLADAVLSGALVDFDRDDPLALSDLIFYLPTRRAVRAFREALAARLANAILPQVRALGDADDDEMLFAPLEESSVERLYLPPPVSFLARHLALTRLVLAWRGAVRGALLGLAEGESVGIPASAADAARLARDLARLSDDMAIAGVPWDALRTLPAADEGRYFEITLDFLKIVAEQWPAYLAENGRIDPAARRDRITRLRAVDLAAGERPCIVAGSTGSMPATTELIRAVARSPRGAVVLPGLDRASDEEGWTAIGVAGDPGAADAHPQFALKQLVAALGVTRDDVIDLAATPSPARATLLSAAMRTAGATAPAVAETALDGAALISARNEQEEARAIALAVREAVETAGTRVALVTPDRTIARRVAAELARFGLAIDDSAGTPLDREPPGVLARLITETAAEPTSVRVLALAKHPLAAFGMARPLCRRAARALELGVLRGARNPISLAAMAASVAIARTQSEARKSHQPRWRQRLWPEDWALAAGLARAMATALGPLEAALRGSRAISGAELGRLLQAAIATVSDGGRGSTAGAFDDAAGQALAAFLDELAETPEAAALMVAPADAPFFLAELLRDRIVPHPAPASADVHIWGTLEARLQNVDLVILAGLDEGVWPRGTRTDPWLSRAMRAEVGLPAPERLTGLAAHDFVQAMAAPNVIVTRAQKRKGAPTVESRWLQRVRAIAPEQALGAMTARGERYIQLVRGLDVPVARARPVERPAPRPPLAARPHHLSITEIETLIRDPYAIYAKHVLQLQPLEALGQPPDARIKGSLVHDALGRFITEWTGSFDADAERRLIDTMNEALSAIVDAPDVLAVWKVRFAAIGRWLIGFENARGDVEKRHAEIGGDLAVPIPNGTFTLRGRADRIDLLSGNALAIYDFKTGTPQSERSVFAGLTPQMTLEAAMARRGAFAGIAAGRTVRELAWLAIGKCGRGDPYKSAVMRNQTADVLADRAYDMLQGLVAAYADDARGYQSRARPMMESARYMGDYDHLARVREWALVESAEDVAF